MSSEKSCGSARQLHFYSVSEDWCQPNCCCEFGSKHYFLLLLIHELIDGKIWRRCLRWLLLIASWNRVVQIPQLCATLLFLFLIARLLNPCIAWHQLQIITQFHLGCTSLALFLNLAYFLWSSPRSFAQLRILCLSLRTTCFLFYLRIGAGNISWSSRNITDTCASTN